MTANLRQPEPVDSRFTPAGWIALGGEKYLEEDLSRKAVHGEETVPILQAFGKLAFSFEDAFFGFLKRGLVEHVYDGFGWV